MTTGLFAALFVPAAIAAAALGVAAYRLCRAEGPRCWRCGRKTDSQGGPCARRGSPRGRPGKARMRRDTDGRTGYPVRIRGAR